MSSIYRQADPGHLTGIDQKRFGSVRHSAPVLCRIYILPFYVSFGIPHCEVIDKSNRKKIITMALIVWSGMTALSGKSATLCNY